MEPKRLDIGKKEGARSFQINHLGINDLSRSEGKPADHQIEIALFGPGYGECVLIHFGANKWCIVDSCINSETKAPVALEYLQSIGVDPKKAVELIIASHWHDDHIRGLAQVVEACPNATFCSSSVLTKEEFLAYITPFEQHNPIRTGSGVKEWMKILEMIDSRRLKKAFVDRCIHRIDGSMFGHGKTCEIWTLSPSDRMHELFLDALADEMPQIWETKRKACALTPNHSCVVVWIRIGEINMLLGGDLEETTDSQTGWSAIVSSVGRPQEKATIIKVPHHGSSNAHNDDVWETMLINEPYALLTPFNKSGLPTASDVKRILGRTKRAFSSSKAIPGKSKVSRCAAVERTIRETVGTIRRIEPKIGMLRLRGSADAVGDWNVDLKNEACLLDRIHG